MYMSWVFTGHHFSQFVHSRTKNSVRFATEVFGLVNIFIESGVTLNVTIGYLFLISSVWLMREDLLV